MKTPSTDTKNYLGVYYKASVIQEFINSFSLINKRKTGTLDLELAELTLQSVVS